MGWLQKLQSRWNTKSITQVIVILFVFALTGTTVVYIAKPLLKWFFQPDPIPTWAKISYYILILPIYNLILLGYGFIFGQFKFFYEFEKRFLNRFKRKQNK